jgi:ubiquinone biosynthesis protein Coq4
MQKKAAKFAHQKNSSNWEILASRRKLSRICALFKSYSGERAWKAIGDRLKRPHYLSRVVHERKIRSRGQRADIGKYSFVNRPIEDWNQLPAEVLGTLPCKQNPLKKRVRKAIIEVS